MGAKVQAPVCPEAGCGKKLTRCKVLQPRDVNYGRTYDICTKCYLRFWLDDESYNMLRQVDSPAASTLPLPAQRARRPSFRAQSTPPVAPISPPGSQSGRPSLFSLSRYTSGGGGARERQSSVGANARSPQGTRPATPVGSGSEYGGGSGYLPSQPPTPTSSSHPSRPHTPSGLQSPQYAASRTSSPDRSGIYSDDGGGQSAPQSPMHASYPSHPAHSSSYRPMGGHPASSGSFRTPSAPPFQPGRSRTTSQGSTNGGGGRGWFSGLRSPSPSPARSMTLSPPRPSYARTWTPGNRGGGAVGGGTTVTPGSSRNAPGRRMSVGASSYRWGQQGELIREGPMYAPGNPEERYQPLEDPYNDPRMQRRPHHHQQQQQQQEQQYQEQYQEQDYPPEGAYSQEPEMMSNAGDQYPEQPMHPEELPVEEQYVPQEEFVPEPEPVEPPPEAAPKKGAKAKGGKKGKKGAAAAPEGETW